MANRAAQIAIACSAPPSTCSAKQFRHCRLLRSWHHALAVGFRQELLSHFPSSTVATNLYAISDGDPYGQCATPHLHVHARRAVDDAVRSRAGAIMADAAGQVHPDARAGQRGRPWRPATGGPADQEMGPAERDREPTWR